MRKLLLFFVVSSLLLAATTGFAAERMVLMEMFTSTTCPPCVAANQWLNGWYPNHYDDVAIVRYHMNWPDPGNDPFYHANSAEADARRGYYSVGSVPDMWIDCIDTNSYGEWEGLVNSRLAVSSPLEIGIEGVYDWPLGEGSTTVSVTAVEDFSYEDLRLFFLLIENNIVYTGTNGDPIHHQVMRDMVPNATGHPFEISNGETVTFDIDFTLGETWDADNCEILVFVQDYVSRNTHQAMHLPLTDFYPIRMAFIASGTLGISASDAPYQFFSEAQNLGLNDDVYDVTLVPNQLPEAWDCTFTIDGIDYSDAVELPLASNEAALITINFDPHGVPGEGVVEMQLFSQAMPLFGKSLTFRLITNDVDLLIVDDTPDAEASIYQEALSETELVFGTWDVAIGGMINGDDIPMIQNLLWFTGLEQEGSITPDEQAILINYLDNGGKLLLSGRNIGADPQIGASTFYTQYLGATHRFSFTNFDHPLQGIDGDPIGDGLTLTFDPTFPDIVVPQDGLEGVEPAFYFEGYENFYGCLRHESEAYRTVYYSISLDSVVEPDGRSEAIRRSIYWLNGMDSVEPTQEVAVAKAYHLGQNFPNPFNPKTVISYVLPQKSAIKLNVYSITGQLVKTVVDQTEDAGNHSVSWDGTDWQGGPVSSGVYFYELSAANEQIVRQMVLLR